MNVFQGIFEIPGILIESIVIICRTRRLTIREAIRTFCVPRHHVSDKVKHGFPRDVSLSADGRSSVDAGVRPSDRSCMEGTPPSRRRFSTFPGKRNIAFYFPPERRVHFPAIDRLPPRFFRSSIGIFALRHSSRCRESLVFRSTFLFLDVDVRSLSDFRLPTSPNALSSVKESRGVPMEEIGQIVAGMFTTAVVFSLGTFWAVRFVDRLRRTDAQTRAEEIVRRAEREADAKRREAELYAKEQAIQLKEKHESEQRIIRQELHEKERSLDKRQDLIDKQTDNLRKQEKFVESTQRKLTEKIEDNNRRNAELTKLIEKERQTLHEFSGLTREEATERLLRLLDTELGKESGTLILRHEKELNEKCEAMTRNILLGAMQRYAAPLTAEATTSTVDIPNDEMKGRIIGREGRNIRAFEKITGVDIIIDDTPGVVIVSGFDPIRREVARLSLNRLIADGRIHPSRIEEIVAETNREIQAFVQKAGTEVCQEVEVFGLNDRLVNLLGRLHFRTSYSQNVLRHSVEVAFLSGLIAVELGLNEKLARRCGLLHDIGKATDHETEGGHPKIGADLLKRYGEPSEVVQAALGHHEDPRFDVPYTIIVSAADACSASRPGARRESLENYVRRMEELETLASEFPGVEQAYAVQAGRELRVMLNAPQTSDDVAAKTCRDIAKTLTERIQFPGEIKVTVIRETRFTEVAK